MAALPLRTAPTTPTTPAPRQKPRREHSRTAELQLVPRRRRTAGLVVFAALVLASLMLGAALLHTRLAERQLEIDATDRQLTEALARYETLRGERAELRSPAQLQEKATDMGMHVASTSGFIAVDRWALARVIARVGIVDDSTRAVGSEDPLDQFRKVKDVEGTRS